MIAAKATAAAPSASPESSGRTRIRPYTVQTMAM
jgi:hypothetical protein